MQYNISCEVQQLSLWSCLVKFIHVVWRYLVGEWVFVWLVFKI